MKRISMMFILLATFVVGLRADVKVVFAGDGVTELQTGGQFMDLLLPMEGSVPATESDWGTTAGENTQYAGTWEGTLGRWKDNGIEDTERSYWGANIIKGSDGKYHMYVAGWPSATCGHMQWSSKSMVYHVTSDNVWGPYTYVSTLGTGHNPEIYKTGDTYVIYRIEPLGYYKSTTLGDTWETGEYVFDLRDRALIAGENRETSLSNCSFAKREDGSFVMIDRGGGIWVSRDGLTDPWHQISTSSVYLNSTVTNRGTLEDPVIWRDHLQYHMIVNDWKARYAYYYRSKDGLHWVMETGKAYTGQDPFAKHTDGIVEAWHKYERPRIYQDELGRAIRMNFAVIDCVKQSDVAGDTHSSKNINMPITRQLQLEVLGNTPITSSTTSIRVLVKAEDGFNPRTDLNLTSLKFGAHNKVNFGNGFTYSSSENSGSSDLIITFTGVAGQSGIDAAEWAPKMLGKMTDGSIAFGYAKMPGIDYKAAMLSAVTPAISADGTVQSVSVTNYGEQAATATTVRIYAPNGTTLLAHGTTLALAAYSSETVNLTKDATAGAGYKAIIVRFYNGEILLNEEMIALTAINDAQTALQNIIDEAEELYNDSKLTNGKPALLESINAAKAVVGCYNISALTEQQTTLNAALNTYKYANASPANGLAITIPNATMEDLSEWILTRKDADNAPGWKTNTKGASYEGFEGNFMEYWVSQAGALGYANRAYQSLTNMPAGRYRLRASIIATRQNSNDAVTGVALYANSERTTCATAKDGTPQEFMAEINMAEEGTLEIGIDVAATTTANWVAWDNVTLKYFGTQEGDIVEEEVEPLSFDQSKVYRIKWYDHTTYTKIYWQSPKFDTSGNNTIHRTSNQSEAAQFIIRSTSTEGQFYLYDVVSQQYVVPSGNSNNGTAWTWSATTLGKTVITESGDAFTISSTAGGYANAYANDNNDADVKNYGGGSKWAIEEAGENTAIFGINPKAVYRLTHHNTNRYRYLASVPSNEGYLLTTNTDSEKGEYSLLPVSGQEGYYYLYNKDGYFVTPTTGNWTLSKTTPAAVKIEINTEYMEDYLSSHPTTNITFMLGEANQHANAQRINNVELVKAYSDHPLDKGNNWVLEPVGNAMATLPLTNVTSGVQSLVQSAVAEDVTLTYTATVGTAGYGTLVVPFEADVEGDVKVYTLTNVNGSNAVIGQKVTTIEANKPVLLRNSGTLQLTAKNGTAAYDATPINGLLAGSYTSRQVPAGSFVLQKLSDGVGFYQVESGNEPTINPFRAYLTTTTQARYLSFSLDEATSVSGIQSVPGETQDIYSIGGYRLTAVQRGLNIIRTAGGAVMKVYKH
ncbi:MAG: glycoside hydrolase family protein [Prevotella sp.]|nr:glycoside hydrolase family protein [Prevotella sp.]